LFTANPSSKQSFTQLAAKNASMSTNIKTNLFKASEIDAKKTIEQVARSSGFSSNSFNLTSPKTTNIASNKINVANQDNKIAQRNSNSKASRFVSPAHQVQVI
jgi:predicted DsbA family dithiol-disulfide isomerase